MTHKENNVAAKKRIEDFMTKKSPTVLVQADIDADLHAKVKAKLSKMVDFDNTWKGLIESSFRKFLEEK